MTDCQPVVKLEGDVEVGLQGEFPVANLAVGDLLHVGIFEVHGNSIW